ncbi:hypothetical protein ACFQ4Y_06285 [Kroppenstedtia sanguinis]|uniref:Uncharacterized protein n=2 Tax=Kroppenstedtia sanguinis TaxID=1380684 RepID=A0ABW4C747_9BACL
MARLVPYGCKATFVPWALQSKGAEALDEGSHPTQRRIWREGVLGQHLPCVASVRLCPCPIGRFGADNFHFLAGWQRSRG